MLLQGRRSSGLAGLGLVALIVFLLLPASGAADEPSPAPPTAEGEFRKPPPDIGKPRGHPKPPDAEARGSTPGDEPGQTRVPDPDEIEASDEKTEERPKP